MKLAVRIEYVLDMPLRYTMPRDITKAIPSERGAKLLSDIRILNRRSPGPEPRSIIGILVFKPDAGPGWKTPEMNCG